MTRELVKPKPNRWDWFEVDLELGKELQIARVPGVAFRHGKFEVHRTHLHLLGEHAAELIVGSGAPSRTHEERVVAAKARDLVLRSNQQTGLDFIEPRRGVLVGDEMRLGKTLTALMAHDPSTGPLFVLAPLSTRPVWLEWMKRLWPGVEPFVVTGKTLDMEALKEAEIIFAHYDVLTYHKLSSIRPGTLICDEVHVLSNPKSQRTNAVLFFAINAYRTIALSGTPLWNKSKGLWGLLAVTNPGAWGSLFEFSQRYCQPTMGEYGWQYEGISNVDEWDLRRKEILIARRWADVRADLPPIQRNVEVVDLDSEDLLKLDVLAFELRKNDRAMMAEVLGHYRQAIGLYKVDLAVDLADRVLSSGDHVVVWAWHKKVANAIAKKISKKHDALVVTGDDGEVRRSDIIADWKRREAPTALVLTMAVGQVGIDLSKAHHAVVAEYDWTPAVMSQMEMRTFSPDCPMALTYVKLNHDVDAMLLDALLSKIGAGETMGMAAAGSAFDVSSKITAQDTDVLEAFAKLIL